jgi:hypothetical protein
MSAPLRDPKDLPAWLELDYFRRPRGLRRWTRVLCWTALALTVALVLFTLLWPRQRTFYKAGPVATPHQMFGHDCGQCHTEAFNTVARLWPPAGDFRSVPDQNCLACHPGPHHAGRILKEEAGCATCHREHRGQAALARPPDAHCTRCHADLEARHPEAKLRNVSAFTRAGHPPVRWWEGREDPGTIAFNHRVHLAEEGLPTLDPKQVKAMWGEEGATNGPPDRPAPHRKRLNCESCHQPDESGRYMKPISFEQHCKECHPLSVRVTGPLPSARLRKAAGEFAATPAPHREPKDVRAALRDRYAELAGRFRQDLFGLPAADPEAVPALPWRPDPPPESKQEWDWVQGQLHTAEQVLFTRGGGCAYCHTPTEAWKSGKGKGGLPEYLPSRVNRRPFAFPGHPGTAVESALWLPQARFDHHAHRAWDCGECHPAKTSTRTADVLIPPIDNCMSCHNARAGARSDCAECHLYHPREGRHDWKTGGAEPWRGTKTVPHGNGAGYP